MKLNFSELFKDIPECLAPPIDMVHPNERIPIYNGQFVIKQNTKEYNANGEIYYSWFPSNSARFTAVVTGSMSDLDPFNPFEVWIDDFLFSANASVTETTLGFGSFDLKGKCNDGAVLGDRSLAVSEISFVIPNLRKLEENPIKDEANMFLGRTTLTYGKYIIILDAFRNHQERNQLLNNNGGYHFTYTGTIKKVRGSLRLKEIEKLVYGLSNFLSFVNGRRVAPMFLSGIHGGEKLWTEYGPAKVDPFKAVKSWAQSHQISGLNNIWLRFNQLWEDDSDRDFLETAIHWYVEANSNSGYVEGSIIFAQTALELLYNWLVLEKKKIMKGQDAEGLSAANKIRLVISQFRANPEIPASFKKLKKYSSDEDGPGIFVFLRNCLVHGQEKKRIELNKIDLMAKYEAVSLAVWYIELALLYILGFNSLYHNRTSGKIYADTGDVLPWSTAVK